MNSISETSPFDVFNYEFRVSRQDSDFNSLNSIADTETKIAIYQKAATIAMLKRRKLIFVALLVLLAFAISITIGMLVPKSNSTMAITPPAAENDFDKVNTNSSIPSNSSSTTAIISVPSTTITFIATTTKTTTKLTSPNSQPSLASSQPPPPHSPPPTPPLPHVDSFTMTTSFFDDKFSVFKIEYLNINDINGKGVQLAMDCMINDGWRCIGDRSKDTSGRFVCFYKDGQKLDNAGLRALQNSDLTCK